MITFLAPQNLHTHSTRSETKQKLRWLYTEKKRTLNQRVHMLVCHIRACNTSNLEKNEGEGLKNSWSDVHARVAHISHHNK